MTKLKVLFLCLASSLLTIASMSAVSHINFKNSPQLTIKGPSNLAKGEMAQFRANIERSSWFLSKTIFQWKVLHSKGVINYLSSGNGDIFFPVGLNKDKFWVVCSAVNHYNYILWNNVEPLDTVVMPLNVGDPAPDPPNPGPLPPPDPPGPTPIPVTTSLWAISVFDNNNPLTLTSDQLVVHNSSEDMQASLKPLSVIWRNYDKASPTLQDASWQTLLSKTGVPALIIVDEKGKSYYEGKLVSKNDVINRVNSIRGK